MRAAASITVIAGLLAGLPLRAQQTDLLPGYSVDRGIACWVQVPEGAFSGDFTGDTIDVTSGDADIQANGDAVFSGPVVVSSDARSLKANSASYKASEGIFEASGGVVYEDDYSRVSGDSVLFNAKTGQLNFSGTEFAIASVPARGSAEQLDIWEKGVVELNGVVYTSCPEGNNDWLLKAKNIEVDNNTGRATARGASLTFKRVPIFYLPYFTYPINDERKTGLLFPKFGTSDRRGIEFTQPLYWNIAPNQDATIVANYMSKRGLQAGTEYRYLTRSNRGRLWGDYLADDNEFGADRWRYDINTVSLLPLASRARVEAEGVSDDFYFEDMSPRISLTSQTALNREGVLEHYDSVWTIVGRVQYFQNIDPLIPDESEPYTQVPQIVVDALWRDGPLGLQYGFGSETTYFYRDESVRGLRAHVRPRLALPLRARGLYLTPEAEFDITTYSLDDQTPGLDSTPRRTAPILSVDTGAVLERTFSTATPLSMTIEPRALYTYIPFRDQDDIPIFDTIQPDFNLIQLYRQNRFVGYDRLGDTNQISLGFTSRVFDDSTGRELLTATLGQTRFLSGGEVQLPGETPTEVSESNFIGELSINFWGDWNADMRYQVDTETVDTVRGSVRFQYRPDEMKAVNVGYRYVRDSVDQTDFSFAWPVTASWSAIGRYNYSLVERKALDTFLGVEYSSCCWGFQVVGRQSVVRSTGERDKTIAVQLVFKGFSGLGSETTTGLRRDILGGAGF